MKPTPAAELVVEMEEQPSSTMEMDVDDVDDLDIFRESLLETSDHRRLTDSGFFNSFEDDFNDADIN